eukprot:6270665-Prymnesium_polylepis.1
MQRRRMIHNHASAGGRAGARWVGCHSIGPGGCEYRTARWCRDAPPHASRAHLPVHRRVQRWPQCCRWPWRRSRQRKSND